MSDLFRVDQRFEGAFAVGTRVLNLGAGFKPIQGAMNHDAFKGEGIDIAFDLLEVPWPLDSSTFHTVSAFHCIEHIPISKILGPLFEIHRIMVPCGMAIFEIPDFKEAMKRFVNGDIGMADVTHGSRAINPFDAHRWPYSAESLATLLWSVGFEKIHTGPGKDYHSKQIPTIRIEACRNAIIS